MVNAVSEVDLPMPDKSGLPIASLTHLEDSRPQSLNELYDGWLLRIRETNVYVVIGLIALTPTLLTALLRKLAMYYPAAATGLNPVFNLSVPMFILVAVFVAPMIETLLFQKMLLFIGRHFLRLGRLSAVLLSSLAFALAHNITPSYVAAMFFIGFLFGSLYLARDFKGGHAWLVTTVAHGLANAAFLIGPLQRLF